MVSLCKIPQAFNKPVYIKTHQEEDLGCNIYQAYSTMSPFLRDHLNGLLFCRIHTGKSWSELVAKVGNKDIRRTVKPKMFIIILKKIRNNLNVLWKNRCHHIKMPLKIQPMQPMEHINHIQN